MVLSPEHPLTMEVTTKEHKKTVQEYKEKTLLISLMWIERLRKTKPVFLLVPMLFILFTKKEIPIWIADYVLMDYWNRGYYGCASS